MTYAQGQPIQSTDYNTLSSQLAGLWGTGSTRYGLGQSTSAFAPVSEAVPVTATQWTGLFQNTNNLLAHEAQTPVTPSSVTAGNPITFYNSLNTGLTTAATNMGTAFSTSDGPANPNTYAAAWGTAGARRLRFTFTVTFASADQARYFFNAGGKLKLTFSRSGGSATTRNAEWTDLCNQCGTISYGYRNTTKAGGSGTTTTLLNSNNGGYWNSTTSEITHFLQYADTSPYTINYIAVSSQLGGSTSNGGYSVVYLQAYWENDYTNAFQDGVDGTCTTSLTVASPATTYITNSWGTPTVGVSVVAE